MSQIKIEVRSDSAGTATFLLSGEIDENSDFSAVVANAAATCVLDIGEISRINSSGVRRWMDCMTALVQKGAKIVLDRCSVPMVQQLNMIRRFHGGGEVRSLFAPYLCAKCNDVHTRLLPVNPELHQKLEASVPCPKCGRRMEFDDLPDSFLAFLRTS